MEVSLAGLEPEKLDLGFLNENGLSHQYSDQLGEIIQEHMRNLITHVRHEFWIRGLAIPTLKDAPSFVRESILELAIFTEDLKEFRAELKQYQELREVAQRKYNRFIQFKNEEDKEIWERQRIEPADFLPTWGKSPEEKVMVDDIQKYAELLARMHVKIEVKNRKYIRLCNQFLSAWREVSADEIGPADDDGLLHEEFLWRKGVLEVLHFPYEMALTELESKRGFLPRYKGSIEHPIYMLALKKGIDRFMIETAFIKQKRTNGFSSVFHLLLIFILCIVGMIMLMSIWIQGSW